MSVSTLQTSGTHIAGLYFENITGIKLTVTGVVPGLTAEQFEAAAEDAKENCPVSKAITGTTITLEASLAKY